ncbi:TPA: TetR/AcrR family transcriptional regulator [Enterococcus faecium]
MRVTKSAAIEVTSNLADEIGLNNVSLKKIAEKLNIQTPSLYNHIDSLDDLLREVGHKGMLDMNDRMMKVAVGTYGDSAIKTVAIEYLNFMIEHPGVYEIIQWTSWNGNDKTAEIFSNYTSLLTTLILSCNFNKKDTENILNLLTGTIHGYTTLQLRNAFTQPNKVRNELSNAIDTVLIGVHQKYDIED